MEANKAIFFGRWEYGFNETTDTRMEKLLAKKKIQTRFKFTRQEVDVMALDGYFWVLLLPISGLVMCQEVEFCYKCFCIFFDSLLMPSQLIPLIFVFREFHFFVAVKLSAVFEPAVNPTQIDSFKW